MVANVRFLPIPAIRNVIGGRGNKLVTIRAEERLAQGIKDGTALVTGDLSNVTAAARSDKTK